MSVTVLFYCVFLCQIFVMSVYYPAQIHARISTVLRKYPPQTHPKFYPAPFDKLAGFQGARTLFYFALINGMTAGIGICILLYALQAGYKPSGNGEELLVTIFFFVQAAPQLLLELSTFRHFRKMRQARSQSQRSASLTPRHLSDYAPRPMIWMALIFTLICISFFIYTDLILNHRPMSAATSIFAVVLTNGFFIFMVRFFMRGPKLDPWQKTADRFKHARTQIRIYFVASIGMSVFLFLDNLVKLLDIAFLQPVIFSIFFQLLVIFGLGTMLRTLELDDIDFDVYRKGGEGSSKAG
ncbi:MAG: hypothetical protein JKY49_02165 [Cohaesibacteraceae bacterium]|nr:hypothetical protein [Cohaesibacteraceae bacterium]MBL4875060.1 hypothetical protein [Cohaesibacteraceae bacterium]